MRVKVIPKRGFRLWEPALAGAALAVPVHAASLHVTYTDRDEWLLWALSISATVAFPIIDAISHRRFWRALLRSTLFGIVFGFSWATLSTIDIPVYYVMYASDGGWLGVTLATIIITTVGAVSACITSNALLMLILGRHIHPRDGLCHGCLYPLEGLSEQTRCPECGRERDEPLRSIWPNAPLLRRVTVALATLALLGQAVYTTAMVRRFIVPINKFESAVPASLRNTTSTYITMYFPHPRNDAANPNTQANETRVLRKANVRLLAEERDLTLTHLTTFLIIDHNGAPTRIEIVAGEVLGSASWGFARGDNPENDGLVWTLNPEATQRFLNGEGLTEQRIIAILDQIRPNDLTNTNRRRELDW